MEQVTIAEIKVSRETRQRKSLGDIGVLADSIRRVGLINPITIDKNFNLIAGERRLEACKMLAYTHIPVRFYEELSQVQKELIEFEENAKRESLPWQEQTLATKKIHEIYSSTDTTWTIAKTAEATGLSAQTVLDHCKVADLILKGDISMKHAQTLTTAVNIIERAAARAIDNELNNLIEVEDEREPLDESISVPQASQTPSDKVPQSSAILNEDFNIWARAYKGRRFNFIHCDFPYGINHQDSDQGGIASGRFNSYDDGEGVYWSLLETLCGNLSSITTSSAHLMFWFSMNFYSETIHFIENHSDFTLAMPQPLIWLKSDGKGIASDVNRRPRNVYETALLFSRGDRKILTPVDNAYACPTSRDRVHASEKPEPMLRHFFRMFLDGNGEMLDPTCGAGSSIRAAESLGAKRVLGIEKDKGFAEEAERALKKSRALERLSLTLGD